MLNPDRTFFSDLSFFESESSSGGIGEPDLGHRTSLVVGPCHSTTSELRLLGGVNFGLIVNELVFLLSSFSVTSLKLNGMLELDAEDAITVVSLVDLV